MRALFHRVIAVSLSCALAGCGTGKGPGDNSNQADPPKSALSVVDPGPMNIALPGSATLDGVYELTELFYLGQWTAVRELKNSPNEEISFIIKGDSMTSNLLMKSESQKIRIDGTKSPAQIDIVDRKSVV